MTSQEFLEAYPGIEFKKYSTDEIAGHTFLGVIIPKHLELKEHNEVIADLCAQHFGFWLGVISSKVDASHVYGLLIKGYNKLNIESSDNGVIVTGKLN